MFTNVSNARKVENSGCEPSILQVEEELPKIKIKCRIQ